MCENISEKNVFQFLRISLIFNLLFAEDFYNLIREIRRNELLAMLTITL